MLKLTLSYDQLIVYVYLHSLKDIPNPRKRQLAPSLVHAEPASISLSDSATNAQPSSARTERTVKKELERDVDISNPESFDEERTVSASYVHALNVLTLRSVGTLSSFHKTFQVPHPRSLQSSFM